MGERLAHHPASGYYVKATTYSGKASTYPINAIVIHIRLGRPLYNLRRLDLDSHRHLSSLSTRKLNNFEIRTQTNRRFGGNQICNMVRVRIPEHRATIKTFKSIDEYL